jgi:hypothetical protein
MDIDEDYRDSVYTEKDFERAEEILGLINDALAEIVEYINHGISYGKNASELLGNFCTQKKLDCMVHFDRNAFITEALSVFEDSPEIFAEHARDALLDALHVNRVSAEVILEDAPDPNDEHRTY